METKPHPLALGTAASLLSLIGGMAVMYYGQEGRIEKRTEERVKTAISLAEIDGRLEKLDSREWENRGRMDAAIKQLQADFSVVKDRILVIETKQAKP